MRSERPRFVATPTIAGVVVATLAGVLQAAAGFTSAGLASITALLAVLMMTVGTAGMRWAERQPGDRPIRRVLAVYAALVVGLVVASRGRAFVATMPFVSMLVLYLPLGIAAIAIGGLTALLSVFAAKDWGVAALPGAVLQIGAAESFVVIFTLIAKKERYARAEVERLQRDVALLATTRERGRVARELHDSLGHYLTVISIQLEALAAGGESAPPERLERVRRLLREALTELRRTVTVLRTTPEEALLSRRLEALAAEHRAAGLDVELAVSGAEAEPPPELGDMLFRVAQEALTNVQRHAHATHARVTLTHQECSIVLEVVDDGVGKRSPGAADASDASDASDANDVGSGLTGLRERVTALGGTFAAAPTRDRGFRVFVEAPKR